MDCTDKITRWRGFGLALALLLAVTLLAACGGDEGNEDTSPPPTTTPGVSAEVVAEDAGEVGEVASEPASTPPPLPAETLFQDATALARADLAAYLEVGLDEITVLEPDTALLMADPLSCPDIADEGVTPYTVYVQRGRFIYPYQVYEPSPGAEPVVERCDDVLVDEEVLYAPAPDVRTSVLDAVRFDLEERGIDTAGGALRTFQAITWTDETLGCPPEPQATPVPALIDGYLVVYAVGSLTYEYHTDATGARIVFCARGGGYESVEAFITALEADENLDVTRVEDEVATYKGLSAQGVLIELTTRGYRVGVFAFDSPDEARAAAALIDDLDVSRIFAAGKVLIVQEENSPQVYSVLLKHAEEVRAPVIERRNADATPASR
ncbi:MAG: hypothetical protein AB1435_06725 [Chloroflexota bacterium]|jgi:hypothetical protein